MDYTNMSLTQAKRLEMESQVRALELEKELEMERTRLAELRKIHYHLAGSSEGWEEVSREDNLHVHVPCGLALLLVCELAISSGFWCALTSILLFFAYRKLQNHRTAFFIGKGDFMTEFFPVCL